MRGPGANTSITIGSDFANAVVPTSPQSLNDEDLEAAAVSAVVAWHAWRYLQLEIEFEDQVLIDTPAWIAHLVVPLAFALISYRFACLAAGRLFVDKDTA